MAFNIGRAAAAASRSLQELIAQRVYERRLAEEEQERELNRQIQLRELALREDEARRRAVESTAARERQARLDAEAAEDRDRERFLSTMTPGSHLSPEQLVRAGRLGLGSLVTMPKLPTQMPGLATKISAPDERPEIEDARASLPVADDTAGAFGTFRGSPKFLAEREQEERARQEREAERAEQRKWREEDREDRQREAALARAENAALRRDLVAVAAADRQAALDAKRAEKAAQEAATRQEAEATRQRINDVATELLNDPALNRAVGVFDGRTPAVRPDTQDFINKFENLKSMLAVRERGKLKGQGAITDKETEMLEKAVSALFRTGSEAAFRRELNRIIEATKPRLPAGADLGADW